MRVSFVTIKKRENGESTSKVTSVKENGRSLKRARSSGDSPKRKMPRQLNPVKEIIPTSVERITDIMCYICTLNDTPGTLSLEKCVERGVKPGPQLQLLKAGKDITLPDGTVVYSKDVVSDPKFGPRFAIVDCPSEDYLDNLVNHPAFKQHQMGSCEEEQMVLMVHYTNPTLFDHPKYREWMRKFGPTTYHIPMNESNSQLVGSACYLVQAYLNQIAPQMFPKLHKSYQEHPPPAEDESLRIIRDKKWLGFVLKPECELLEEPSVDPILTQQLWESNLRAGLPDFLRDVQTKFQEEWKALADEPEYPKIVMLGTASCQPNAVRNVSGILLRINEEHSMLLDCGEGTYSQMVRYFGKDNTSKELAKIKIIYVSHVHADHHMGIIQILIERSKITEEPVIFLLPETLSKWLKYYSARFQDIGNNYQVYCNRDFLRFSDNSISRTIMKQLLSPFFLRSIETVLVEHCLNAYGVMVTTMNGKKIVYSGDTMPHDALVNLGKNCDLLIHEATLEDQRAVEAQRKMHSTVSQAIDVGRRMQAKNILLTHFSQRYSKWPLITDANMQDGDNIAVSYDFMEISLSKFKLLRIMMPAFKYLFARKSKKSTKGNHSDGEDDDD